MAAATPAATPAATSANAVRRGRPPGSRPRVEIDPAKIHVQPAKQDELMTIPETAKFLRVSVSKVNRWTMHRTGPKFYRVGRRIVFRLPDLIAFVDKNAVHPISTGRKHVKA